MGLWYSSTAYWLTRVNSSYELLANVLLFVLQHTTVQYLISKEQQYCGAAVFTGSGCVALAINKSTLLQLRYRSANLDVFKTNHYCICPAVIPVGLWHTSPVICTRTVCRHSFITTTDNRAHCVHQGFTVFNLQYSRFNRSLLNNIIVHFRLWSANYESLGF